MKKITGFLCTGVLVMTLFLNTNLRREVSTHLDLNNLVKLNNVNAECDKGITGVCRITTSGVEDCMMVGFGFLVKENCR